MISVMWDEFSIQNSQVILTQNKMIAWQIEFSTRPARDKVLYGNKNLVYKTVILY